MFKNIFGRTPSFLGGATSTEVIEEIHNAFDIAADNALAEAKAILEKPKNDDELQMAIKLKSAGFTSAPLVEKAQKVTHEIGVAAARAKAVTKYQQKYPQYKFIFLDQVIDICQKYGLVFGEVSRYIGKVPKKNIEEIANFSVKAEDKYKYTNYWGYDEGLVQAIRHETSHFVSESELERIRSEESRRRQDRIYHHVSYDTIPFFICAPKSDMKTDQRTKQKGIFLTQEAPDPIVLHFVKDGFLVVSKWGIEGEDPALTNEKMN